MEKSTKNINLPPPLFELNILLQLLETDWPLTNGDGQALCAAATNQPDFHQLCLFCDGLLLQPLKGLWRNNKKTKKQKKSILVLQLPDMLVSLSAGKNAL